MSKLVGCDYTCQRKKNIDKLRDVYETGIKKYYDAYNKYLQYKYDKSSERAWKKNYAETTLRPKVEKLNSELNKILENVKKNINNTSGIITKQSANIDNQADTIHKKNQLIRSQDKNIQQTNIALLSKNRQISFTKERNSYRRIMLILLIVVNILIMAGIYAFYKSRTN